MDEVIDRRLNGIEIGLTRLEASVEKLTDAMVQLARLDVQLANNGEAVRRAFEAIEKLSEHLESHEQSSDMRLRKLEEAAPVNKLVTGWVLSWLAGVGGLAGGIAIGVIYALRSA